VDGIRLDGHVVVVAGLDPMFGTVARALASAGASVARIGDGPDEQVALSVLGDPADPSAWARVAPHVEQRLGPVDAVVCDAACEPAVTEVFAPDLRRRGREGIVRVDVGEGVAVAVSSVRRMLRATPARLRRDAPPP
jgi:NAD(P)-dependent dehydrogenase (short-subunit alcohol dehydrogenase family)